MGDAEDVMKMIEFIKLNQEDNIQDFQYDDFINCENSDIDEDEEICCDNNELSNFRSTDISKLNSYDPKSTLKPGERAVIDSCSDPELKNLLLLNRTKNLQLMQLYKKLKDLLIQCQKDICEKRVVINNFFESKKEQAHSSGAWRLAAPYFKDKKLYACPPNADTIRKRKNKELCIYEVIVPLKWSRLECEKLIRSVKLYYNTNQQHDILKKIDKLQQNKCKDGLAELQSRIEELRNDDNSEIPPLNSDQYIDWLRVAETFFHDRRSYIECRSFWHIYLHPQINKSPWTPEENAKLKTLVRKYKFQNWDTIAEALGNNRTGFTACMNYYNNLHSKFKKGDFTNEEDSKIIRLVHKHKMGNYIPWVKIAQHFKNRTRAQLHYRYTYYLTQNDKRKGKFTDAEDILIMILVDRFGKNFKKCSEYLPTRSMVQIKARYNTNLKQKLKKGSFTIEDDEIILKFVEENGYGSWTKLTKVLQRCRGQIRQRYTTISTYLQRNPNSTVIDVPRRKHNLREEEDSFNFLRMVADQFLDSPNIPSLQEIDNVLNSHHKEDLQINDIPNFKKHINVFDVPLNIDDMLTNFFCNSYKTNASKCISSKFVKRAATDVQEVLNILNATLDIPPNFDEDIRLDNLDVAILNTLVDCGVNQNKGNKNVNKLVPPNLNSLVGLRSFLIKYYINKSEQEKPEYIGRKTKRRLNIDISSDIVKQLLNLSEKTRSLVESDRALFYKRFQAIFKWPAIMTLQNPSSELQDTSSYNFNPTKIQVKRTYSKLDRNKTNECPEKRLKTTNTPSSSSTKKAPLKLTPVTNKSVIEDLIKNRNKKLFSMETVKCDGGTKMLIKEVNFHQNANDKSNKADSHIHEANIAINNKKDIQRIITKPPNKKICIIGNEKLSLSLSDKGDDSVSAGDDSNNKDTDDAADLNRLEAFLKEHCSDPSNEDDDLEDLKKLEAFLKNEEESEIHCIEPIPSIL